MSGVRHVVLVISRYDDEVVEVLGPFNSQAYAQESVIDLDRIAYRTVSRTLHPVLDAAYMDES